MKAPPMATYLFRATYSNAAFAGMISSPSDRGPAIKALAKAGGLKVSNIYYCVSTGELVCILEGTAEQLAAMCMVGLASGGVTAFNTQELVSTATMHKALTTAGKISGKYQAPNK
jgi:uncharacterized protein with GYD domain